MHVDQPIDHFLSFLVSDISFLQFYCFGFHLNNLISELIFLSILVFTKFKNDIRHSLLF